MFREATLALMTIGALIGGCSAPRAPIVVTNPDPAGKIPAMKKAVREKDLSVVRQLIKDLDSDDAAIRLFAIRALHQLTGQHHGYTYYHDEAQRRNSLQRWQEWLAQQEGTTPTSPPATRPGEESRLVGGKPGE